MELNSIAFIPDGNRRYAKLTGISLLEAYKLGTQKAWQVIDWLDKYKNIKTGTFYTLSLENLRRSKLELHALFKIFEKELNKVESSGIIEEQGIKLKFVGRTDLLPKNIQEKMAEAEKLTENHDRRLVNLAIGYNGQQEIVDAAKKIALKFKEGAINLAKLTPETFREFLYSPFTVPDYIIRTSGMERLSGFLTYQSSYAELKFVPKYWPELTEEDLDDAVRDYYHRKRTFGK